MRYKGGEFCFTSGTLESAAAWLLSDKISEPATGSGAADTQGPLGQGPGRCIFAGWQATGVSIRR